MPLIAEGGAESKDDLREKKVDELRGLARDEGIKAPSKMRKAELVDAIAEAQRRSRQTGGSAGQRGGAGQRGDAGPDSGHVRTGKETSRSLQYSQEVTSPDDDPEQPGRSLATTSHEVIRGWAEARGGKPSSVDGTEHGDHLGVLRFDFGGGAKGLRHVSWDEWFATFDTRELNFVFQEERADGRQSNFFRLESPDREDA